MPYLQTSDGTKLAVSDAGTGKPIVLIHGWAMGADMWEYQIPALLEAGFRCVSYDQRGCGASDHPSRGYDFDTLADDLAGVMDHLDLHGATLVGYSLGGGVVARYLSRHGNGRVSGVVLLGTNTPYLLKSETNPEGMDRALVYDPFLAGLQTDRPKLLASVAGPFFGPGKTGVPASPELMQWAVGLCFRSNAMGMLTLYRSVNETDFRGDMASFERPTLLIHGDCDVFQPLQFTAQRTAAAIPGSRLIIYEGAAHGLFFTHKERLNADLKSFVNSVHVQETIE